MIDQPDGVVMGIDAGTSGLRAGLFTLNGDELGFAEVAYPTAYPRPGWAEQHPQDWWDALVVAVRQCLRVSGVAPQRVVALAIDAPCTILLVDRTGAPITESLMWMDLRGAEQAHRLTATHDPVLRYCGGEVPAEWPLPKALWLKEQAAAHWNAATALVEQLSWLTWRLTGKWAIAQNSATAKWQYRLTATADVPAGWPQHLLDAVDLTDLAAKVPGHVTAMGQRVGALTQTAAAELGLPPDVAVAMSGIDAHAGLVGLNALHAGTLALITGTSTCQLAQSPGPVFDAGLWGPFEGAIRPDQWTIEAGQASTGGTVRWVLDLMGAALGEGNARYAVADALAQRVPPGAEGLTLLDFWQGSRTPHKDATARGTIWGLTPAHTLGHVLRAVYEGTAYGNRHILAKLAELGVPTARMIACGGGTRSDLWLQILADVAGVPITLTRVADAVTLGSAMCAAVGAGVYRDLAEAGAAMVQETRTIFPDPQTKPVYDAGYARYLATYMALAPLFATAARVENRAEDAHT